MYSARGTAALPAVGFPIRTFPDRSLVGGSPRLFAASHVLHRLRLPRHPPCALRSLVTSSSLRPRGLRYGTEAKPLIRFRFSLHFSMSVERPLQLQRDPQFDVIACGGGADRNRTDDIQLAKLALYQLSYGPVLLDPGAMVGLERFELSTPRLSSVCSNQLSYRPVLAAERCPLLTQSLNASKIDALARRRHRSLKTKQRESSTPTWD